MEEGGALMGERVATEKEREKVGKKSENMHKTCTGDCTRKLFPKPIH